MILWADSAGRAEVEAAGGFGASQEAPFAFELDAAGFAVGGVFDGGFESQVFGGVGFAFVGGLGT